MLSRSVAVFAELWRMLNLTFNIQHLTLTKWIY